ncbi:MAG: YebC/PmpR family DNA-binding transcriptional regulator, partial [Candidatus Absconditabacterales bacterium]
MGRRHSIAGKKAAGDAKKSANYGKIGKIIQIAAKKGADPKMNPTLDLALSKARQFGLPKEVIQKAILKGSGQLVGEDLQEVFYEGYGPGGSAFVVKTLTPNTNRTSSNIKGIIGKHGGTMGLQGSVSRQFKETGVIVTDGKISKENINGKITDKIIAIKNDEFENEIINLNIQDFEIENGQAVIYTDK